jgi:hypothetical protein
MAPSAKELLRRYRELQDNRGTWESHWQEISDYGIGSRDFTNQTIAKGRKRGSQIFDPSFMHAGKMLASGLHSQISNPATRWFRLKLEDDRLMDIEEIAIWIQMAEERLYNAFNRPEAGFNTAQREAYSDIVYFGTGGVYIKDGGPRGAIFMSSPISGLYLGENAEGRLDTYMWTRKLTAAQIVEEYGMGASERASKSIDGGQYEAEYDVLRIVMPRSDPQISKLGYRGMPWASYHIMVDEAKIVLESGYEERPFAVARWDKDSGEIYGRGPGITALVSQKVLNEQKKTLLKAAQKRVDPSLVVPGGGVITALQTQPGGISVAKSAYMQGGKPPIYSLEAGSDIPIGMEMIDRERQDIRSAFHWELLQLIQHTPGTTPPTATQINEISANQQRVISPILGGIQEELLEPEVERVWGIELRAGRLPPVPAVLNGQNLRIEYVSPAARAQRFYDAKAIRNVMATAAEYGQFDPVALKMLKGEEAIRFIADAEGIPVGILRSRKELAEILEAERRIAMQQAQMQQAQQQVEMASKAVPALQAIQGGKAA